MNTKCIQDSDIIFTKGNTCYLKFQRIGADGNPILTKASKVYFTVKRYIDTDTVIFQKSLTDGTITFTEDGYYHFTINPADTEKLELGNYWYDVEVQNDDYIFTPAKGNLILTYEITNER